MSAQPDTSMQAGSVLVEYTGAIATLTLNRPGQYNALSAEVLGALQSALDSIAANEAVRVVVIAGSGKAFCAGHDLKEMRVSPERKFHQDLFNQCGRMMLTIHNLPQPVIAQVNGIATAAGCQLVAACDLAVAAADARFAVSGINVGLFCSTPAVPLSRNMQRKQAMHMLLTGEFINAETACRLGLVNEIVAQDRLTAATRELALKIADKSPLSIRLGKKMFYEQLAMTLPEAYAFAAERMACNMDSDDAREGIDAFIQKRKPNWTGR
ncbi:MAG: enoyl-CoA hydratase [Gammaproteobacteria bacterium RIFCSPLOWO2_02_FULL_61_13]|nr:MAG: enoyl-CoA hydratase [Gammaproteobacteria bacterium RIFCSPLOWO2_02_FULL_61_13]